MTDYRDRLRVKPGSKVRLKDVDPGYHGDGVTTADAAAMVAAYATGAHCYREIAEYFGVHLATVGRIVRKAMPS